MPQTTHAIVELPKYLNKQHLPTEQQIKTSSIALCLTGERRTFFNHAENIITNIIAPLRAHAKRTFVAAVFKMEKSCIPEVINVLGVGTSVSAIKKRLGSARYDYTTHNASSSASGKKCNRLHPSQWNQFVLHDMCFDLVKQKELELGETFDWIMRVRPDVTYSKDWWRQILQWPFWSDSTTRFWSASCKCHRRDLLVRPQYRPLPIEDLFLVIPRKAAEVFFSAYAEHNEACLNKQYFWSCFMHGTSADNPECYLANRMARYGFIVRSVPAMWMVANFSTRTEWTPQVSGDTFKMNGLGLDRKRHMPQAKCTNFGNEVHKLERG